MTALTRPFRRRLRCGRREPDAPAPEQAARAEPAPEQTPVDIAPNDPLLAHLQGASGAVDLDELELDSPALRELKAAGVKLVVPLVSQGELIGVLNLGPRLSEQDYSSDDRKLLDNLAAQAAPALRVGQLVREQEAEAATRQRFEQELEVARLIQQNFLPKELPDLPGWHVAAYYRPAREVGGDFYDVIPLPDGRVGVRRRRRDRQGRAGRARDVGDAQRAARPAQRLIEPGGGARARQRTSLPRHAREDVRHLPLRRARPAQRALHFANAGHDLPYVKTADGVVELRARGMPLGLMPGMAYEEKEATLAPGDSVLLHSDGVVEAHDARARDVRLPAAQADRGGAPGGRRADRSRAGRARRRSAARPRAGGRHHDGHAPAVGGRGSGACSPSSSWPAPRATNARRSSGWRPRSRISVSSRAPRTPEDGRRRGDDERDGARQRVPAPTARVDPRAPRRRSPARAARGLRRRE